MNSLHAYLAPSHLPANYGGELPEIDYTGADWFPTILTCNDSIRGNIKTIFFITLLIFLNSIKQ